MADHTASGLRAAIKALKDVVAPAVDASNPLAVEQLRMVCGYLALVAEQLPQRSARVRFDFDHARALAMTLQQLAARLPAAVADALGAALDQAHGLASDAPESARVGATARLNAATSAVVRAAADADPGTRTGVERAVLARSKGWLDVERAWFRPLGLDTGAAGLAPLPAAIAAATPDTPARS